MRTPSEQAELQNALNKLCEWTDQWSMKFNESKCHVIHFGSRNNNYDYHMNGVKLLHVTDERDVGVNISETLKPTKHCTKIVNTAKGILRNISRSFHYRDKNIFLKLYTTYVRCHLEYCTPVWSPHSQSDVDLIESVQVKAVGMISGLHAKDYEGKLKELNLLSLKARRERFDMIETYKILHRVNNVDPSTWFELVPSDRGTTTRLTSCDLNLVGKRCNLDVRKHFFSNRVTNSWNRLPSEIKTARTVIQFKTMYDEHLKNAN